MKRHLVLFTSSFPNGVGEPFLEAEFGFLAAHFDRITIVTDGPLAAGLQPRLPPHASVSVFRASAPVRDLLHCIPPRHLVAIGREFLDRFLGHGLSLGAAKVLVADYLKSLALVRHLQRTLASGSAEETYLYAYWHDYKAHAIVLWKAAHPDAIGVARFHRWDIYVERQPFGFLPFKRRIFAGLDRSYAISEHGFRYAKARFPVAPEKIRVSRLGTPCLLDGPPEPSRGTLHVLSVSSLIPRKRVDIVVDALSLVDEPVRWTHVGDGPELEQVRARARERLGSKPNVAFEFTGQLDHREVLSRIRTLANPLFVNVSTSEGIPVSTMEAMSAGIPAVCTNVGGVGEIVEDGVNGFLLPADPTPALIAQKIMAYQRLDVAARAACRAAAFATWQRSFDARINFPAFVEDLLELGEHIRGSSLWTSGRPAPGVPTG